MGNVIGIDLGTTNTAVSVLTDGRPRMLEDARGYKVVPSVVWVGGDGEVKVGQACKSLLITDPAHTAFSVKRLLGRRYEAPEVQEAKDRVGYGISEADDGTCMVDLGPVSLSPVEVSAHILRAVKDMAEKALDGPVDGAVITVPAYFNHSQRAATMEAAAQAGLNCERVLNEPTAAALAYGFRKEIDRTLVIFDLGGGTFDVSVLRLSKGVYEVLATLGDTYLGGEDFDHRIVDWLAERFQEAHGIDLREDRVSLHRLKDAAERAKCELSFTEHVNVSIPQISGGHSVEEVLRREDLQSLVQDYIDRAMSVTLSAVDDANLSITDVDEIILVGGQTRMPAIRQAISDAFGKEPSRSVHPEEVVAMGAAVHASSLEADSEFQPAVLIDVTPFDLGIDTAGGLFQPIITRNSTIPASASRVFATAKAQQASVQITVRQGSARNADANEFLGEFVMSGLTPAPRMETKVEVTFQIDSNGMLHVSAMEPATGKQTAITVRNYSEVAGSKGAVSPNIMRQQGAEEGGKPDPAAKEEAGPAPEAQKKKKKPAKKIAKKVSKKKEKKAKKEGGGLLGALFGRFGSSKSKAPPKATAPAEEAGSSIIDQVVAEREAAADTTDEPVVGDTAPIPVVQMPEIDPSSLEALEKSMDEPEPIMLPDLDPDAIVDLETESVESFAPLDDETETISAASIPVSLEADTVIPLALDEDAVEALDDVDFEAVHDVTDVDVLATDAVESTSAEDEAERRRQEIMDKLSEPIADDGSDDFDDDDFDDDDFDDDDFDDDALSGTGQTGEDGGGESTDDMVTEPPLNPVPPSEPEPEPVAPAPEEPKKKPAKLKLSYKNPKAMVREYKANLERGGCFVKTGKPLVN